MQRRSLLAAAFMGIALTASIQMPAAAQTLTIMKGSVNQPLAVPVNRAVVVQSDTTFSQLSIANPKIADISTLSDKTIYVLGKAPGRTTMTLLAPDGTLISNVEIQVTPDIEEFKQRLQEILPNEHIEVRTANDGIVLSGTVSSTQKLDRALDLAKRYAGDKVSNLMVVGGTQQVMLKVRFAEMQRSVEKTLSSSIGLRGGNSAGVAAGSGDILTQAPGSTIPVTNTGGFGQAQGAMGLGFTAGSLEFGILLQALESKGVVRTLAEPNLTALSGQEAQFNAGGEYPIPVANSQGTISISYKPFGVGLNFTPTVVDGNLINLQINATVSSLDTTTAVSAGGVTVNAFKKRTTSTTVELRDGESFVIAGLLQDDFNDTIKQVPWLGDIPILGALFRSTDYQRKQSELVIIVTPHLVTPVRGDALALPTDRVKLPSEKGLFLLGNVAGSKQDSGAAAEVARQGFSGSYGYSMQ